jgi:hypothetical protein
MNISIIGSWRKHDPSYAFQGDLDQFNMFCFKLGRAIASKNVDINFSITISNDYLEAQRITKNGKPTYLIDDTADFISLMGYLDGCALNKSNKKKINIFISEKMLNGCKIEHSNEGLEPFFNRIYISPIDQKKISLNDYIDIFEIIKIDDSLLRSQMLLRHINSNNIDHLIVIGGGKATEATISQFKPNNITFIPFFGGISKSKYILSTKNNLLSESLDLFLKNSENPSEYLLLINEELLRKLIFENKIISTKIKNNIKIQNIISSHNKLSKFISNARTINENNFWSKVYTQATKNKIPTEALTLLNYYFDDPDICKNLTSLDYIMNYNNLQINENNVSEFYTVSNNEVVLYDHLLSKFIFSMSNLYSNSYILKDKSISKNLDLENIIGWSIDMLLIHESIHISHGIIKGNQIGIGDYYSAIEDADYQADIAALLIQLHYLADIDKNVLHKNIVQYILLLIEIIQYSIKAFAYDGITIEKIEQRRFYRMLHLSFLHANIHLHYTKNKFNNKTSEEVYTEIIGLLIKKPSISFKLKTIVNEDNVRSLYVLDVNSFDEVIPECSLFYKSKFIRAGNIHMFNIKEICIQFQEINIYKINESIYMMLNNIMI